MLAWREFLNELPDIPEGDSTLLDNCLVLGNTVDGNRSNRYRAAGLSRKAGPLVGVEGSEPCIAISYAR